MARLRICSTVIEPRNMIIPSFSKAGQYYTVISSTVFNDGICDCPDFVNRGAQRPCKHLKTLDNNRCKWFREYDAENEKELAEMDECPDCGDELMDFET